MSKQVKVGQVWRDSRFEDFEVTVKRMDYTGLKAFYSYADGQVSCLQLTSDGKPWHKFWKLVKDVEG